MLGLARRTKRNTLLAIISFALVGSLIACGPVMCNPKTLSPVEHDNKIEITTAPTYRSTIGLGIVREIVIQPGIYTAAGQDSNGIWYLGHEDCVKITVINKGGAFAYPTNMVGVATFQKGGILVPTDSSKPAVLFLIYGDIAKKADSKTPSNDGKASSLNHPNQAGEAASQVAALHTPPTATPMQAGAGAGIGAGIAAAFIEADKANIGKFVISALQPPKEFELRKFISKAK